jgi:methionyl-tRNA formyltransferase
MPEPISLVFFGTPAYAVPALRALSGDDRFDVRLVVTQPDRPAGRGHRLTSPAVKAAAEEIGLPVYQPETLRDEASRAPLVEAEADVFVVAAYGLIFGRKTLATPRRGCLNLHASILPAYRGAAPIPAAILSGDAETGVTLMEMEVGLDTGAIVSVARTPIVSDDTTESLTARLGDLGGRLVVDALPGWYSGVLTAWPQPDRASAVRMLSKADGGINWSQTAEVIERRVRAMWPWPRAWTLLDGTLIQIHAAVAVDSPHAPPGLVRVRGRQVLVETGVGALVLETVQLPGGNRSRPSTSQRGASSWTACDSPRPHLSNLRSSGPPDGQRRFRHWSALSSQSMPGRSRSTRLPRHILPPEPEPPR